MTRQQTARLAGALYLAMSVPDGFAILYTQAAFLVPGDAAATAAPLVLRAATMYWGVWLLPLGILVYRSAFLPRLLGILVIIAGSAYVVDCLAYYFTPEGVSAERLDDRPSGHRAAAVA